MRQKLIDFFNLLYDFKNVILWAILFAVSIVFRLSNHIDGSQWVDLTKNTFLGLVAVHGTEHIISVVKEYVNMKGQVTSPVGDKDV